MKIHPTKRRLRLRSQLEVRSDQFDEFKKSFEAQLARESEVQQRLLREKASTQERFSALAWQERIIHYPT